VFDDGLELASGTFSSYNGSTAKVTQVGTPEYQAQAWLNSLANLNEEANLVAWTADSPEKQDQVTVVVPTPTALGGGLAMLGMIVFGNRRRRDISA